MERFIQHLDDLDDLISAVGLLAERLRKAVFSLAFLCASLAIQVGVIILALRHPTLGLAAASLASVTLLYRSVRAPFAAAGRPL